MIPLTANMSIDAYSLPQSNTNDNTQFMNTSSLIKEMNPAMKRRSLRHTR